MRADHVCEGVNRTLPNTIDDAILPFNRERGYIFCMIRHDMDLSGRPRETVVAADPGTVLENRRAVV